MTDLSIQGRASEYARLCGIGLELKTPLGDGTDGTIWRTTRKTAVKSLGRQKNYDVECECYQRLQRGGVRTLGELAVPQLRGFDDRLMVIEMGIVSPPFILDFAKCWLDGPADYTPEVLAEWDADGADRFGKRWPDVKSVLAELRRFGIYYYDAKPGNIRFTDDVL